MKKKFIEPEISIIQIKTEAITSDIDGDMGTTFDSACPID